MAVHRPCPGCVQLSMPNACPASVSCAQMPTQCKTGSGADKREGRALRLSSREEHLHSPASDHLNNLSENSVKGERGALAQVQGPKLEKQVPFSSVPGSDY